MSLKVYPTLPGLTLPVLRKMSFDTLTQSAPNKYETRLPQTVNPVWEWQLVYDFLRDFGYGSFFTVSELRTIEDFFLFQGGQAGDFLFTDPSDNSVGPAMNGSEPNTPLAQLSIVNDGLGNYYSPIQRTLGGLFYEDITDLNGAIVVYANGTLVTQGIEPGQCQVLGPGLGLPGASYMGMYLQWNPPNAWQAETNYSVGAEIMDPAGHIQQCTTHTSPTGGTIPTFNDSGGTTTDGGVIWTDQGYNPGPTGPITAQFSFYFRVHFQSDSQDMEMFSNAFWTIGGSESKNGTGYLTLESSRPNPL